MFVCTMTTGELKEVEYQGDTFYFEWHRALGWMCCDEQRDGVDCPLEVWEELQKILDKENSCESYQ